MCLSPTLRTFRLATSIADDHPSGMRKILVPCIASDWRQRICGRGSSRNLFSECFPGGNSPGSYQHCPQGPMLPGGERALLRDVLVDLQHQHSSIHRENSRSHLHLYIQSRVRFPYLHLLLHFVWLYVRISRSMPRRFYAFANVNPSLRWGMEPRPAHLIAAKTRAPRHRGPIIVRRRNSTSPSCLEHVTFR
ncbi:hypothetical protein BKA93DRAFT_147834 [Sparassis latifolia]